MGQTKPNLTGIAFGSIYELYLYLPLPSI